jgi:hypothetical protein
MHRDPPLGRSHRVSPLFRRRLVVSSHGARCFLFNPTPCQWDSAGCSNGRLQSQVRLRSPCEYDNGYLVFNNNDDQKEVWRLASDFSAEDQVSQPDDQQMTVSARAAQVYHHYAPRGHFRPWALLRFPRVHVRRLPTRIPDAHMRGRRACFFPRRTHGFPRADNRHPSPGTDAPGLRRRRERAPRVRMRGGYGACVLAAERKRDPAHTSGRHRTVWSARRGSGPRIWGLVYLPSLCFPQSR